MDFYKIRTRPGIKKGTIEIYPDFVVGKHVKDLMVRGKSFYAIWDDDKKLWSTNEYDVQRIIDDDLDAFAREYSERSDAPIIIKRMESFTSGKWEEFTRYIKRLPDNFHQLDSKVSFSNEETKRSDYISKRVPYALEDGDCSAYEELISTLYFPEERQKLEWAIGAIIAGDASSIQKFIVLYGSAGAGKSTVLNIIQKLFTGYYTTFNAKELASNNNAFATDVFSNDPLVAIQHDGDLSQIKDNSVLNSIISHEEIIINEKFKGRYTSKAHCFLFMATNKPVKITDSKSGLIRRLIDVKPSGQKIAHKRYDELMEKVDSELGAIAKHCLDVYEELGFGYYDMYKPIDMMFKTDPFFNFVEDNYDVFAGDEGISLKHAYDIYKNYCSESGAEYKMQMYKFREELKNYFKEFFDSYTLSNGTRVRSYFRVFDTKKFEKNIKLIKQPNNRYKWLMLRNDTQSNFDILCEDCPAQYATKEETPKAKWSDVKTTLKDIATGKLHYVKPPTNHIVIDFDLKDENGNKSLTRNLEAARKFPKTYAEVSKGGNGLHLHYIYAGDVSELSRLYSEDIEVKVFTGKSSLRRKLTACNDATISIMEKGFLPLREKRKTKMLDMNAVKDEQHLRNLIKKSLNKEVHAATRPNIDFISTILDEAYENGLKYDVSDMFDDILNFAMNSTHQAPYCVEKVSEMKFESDDFETKKPDLDKMLEQPFSHNDEYSCRNVKREIVFYDVEVFPNLLLVCYKKQGPNEKVHRLFNPTPQQVAELTNFRLVGFNCRRYDNHILYGRMIGESNAEIYQRSQDIINGIRNGFSGLAWNLSYTDIYDYAVTKQSLKKWEIKLHIHHHELGLPWDQPVPEELWETVADYCDDDVLATERVWDETQGDFLAREILAEITGKTCNDTTNSLTGALIFGDNKTPQDEFYYRDLSQPVHELSKDQEEFLREQFPEMMSDTFGPEKSLLPYFPGYEYKWNPEKKKFTSSYAGVDDVGEGGRVWSKPGMYRRVITFDVTSMHPHSAMAEYLFGRYTKTFRDLVYARVFIKHGDFDKVKNLFGGALMKYLNDPDKVAALPQALKIAINSVYGLTSAKFENVFRDPRNKDNIVAKRGALFMINLMNEVIKRGGEVIHIKTDSIKVVDPSPELEEFIYGYGKRYGYSFEIEHIFEKICLVNDAVYIAKLATDDPDWIKDCKKAEKEGKPMPTRWTATGTQFAVPYVFKTLFSKEKIDFYDMCETKSVKTDIYVDMPNEDSDYTDRDAAELTIIEKAKKSKAQNAMEKCAKNLGCSVDEIDDLYSKLLAKERTTHDYRFVGKVGLFCPVKSKGGTLVRKSDAEGVEKYDAVTGTKGYQWLEAEVVEELGMKDNIDTSYYQVLVDDAVDTISEYCDFEEFAA